MNNKYRDLLVENFQIALQAAMPQGKILPFLPKTKPKGRVVVVGAGKAAASMAVELEAVWPYADVPLTGLVITRYGHGLPTKYIEVVEASHPIPDACGLDAAHRLLRLVQDLNADDLVIALMSGGASALLSLPALGMTLHDKQQVNRQLLASGAPIEKMNAVRKHLSAIKGGHLAQAAFPAQVLTLAISDVVGNDLSVIGSGPTVADASTVAEVLNVIAEYEIDLPLGVQTFLQQELAVIETPKALDNSQEAHVIITPDQAFQAAIAHAQGLGWQVMYLGDRISGEAKEVAHVFSGLAAHLSDQVLTQGTPWLILSGGETTVTLPQNVVGQGGRNSEFLLGFLCDVQDSIQVYALAADTDGIDGSEDNAGVWITPMTWEKSLALGLDAKTALKTHQAFSFFAGLEQLLITTPTRTNINDYRAILLVSK